MGTWTFLIPLMFIRALIAAILKIIIIFTGNAYASNAYNKIINGLFFKSFISMSIEGIFCFIIVSYLNIRTIEYISFGEIFGAGLSYYCISISLIVLPSTLILILIFKKYKQIKNEKFLEIWGSLFSFIRMKHLNDRIYYLIFIFRRNLFIGIFLFIQKYPGLFLPLFSL